MNQNHGQFFCPGCNMQHYIFTRCMYGGQIKEWITVSKTPLTMSPSYSYLISDGHIHNCHFLIKNDMIIYCGDCTHKYAGKTIRLETA